MRRLDLQNPENGSNDRSVNVRKNQDSSNKSELQLKLEVLIYRIRISPSLKELYNEKAD